MSARYGPLTLAQAMERLSNANGEVVRLRGELREARERADRLAQVQAEALAIRDEHLSGSPLSEERCRCVGCRMAAALSATDPGSSEKPQV